MRRSNWNSGVPRLTCTFGSTSTAVTSVGSDSRGVSWIVRWITRASVDVGATKRRPMRKMMPRCSTKKVEKKPHGIVNFSHLNLKNTSQTMKP